jgi:hypothetical protein
LLTAIGVAARRSSGPAPSGARLTLGWLLVAVPLPAALALHVLVRRAGFVDQTAFVLGVVAFGIGAFLLMPGSEDERGEVTTSPDPMPWWPAFERQFRAYDSRRTRA